MIKTLKTLLAAICVILAGSECKAGTLPPIQTVFVIVMENSDWVQVHFSPSAPYINGTLLPRSSYCSQYLNLPGLTTNQPNGLHPSEPNYLWLEAGTNFGIVDDLDPSNNHQNTTNHLTTLLKNAGISWRAYQEDISGTYVPLTDTNGFAVRHCPLLYFDDVTGTNNSSYPYGISHIRPYSELAGDLVSNTVTRYNFITPNQCNDMHDICAPLSNSLLQGDTWLAAEIPKITNSASFKNNGAIFITWDESGSGTAAIGMIVLSPLAKGNGYNNAIHYNHSAALRTFQEIFGVTPFLGAAATSTNLSDLFVAPPVNIGYGVTNPVRHADNSFQLTIVGATPGKTNIVQSSTDLSAWTAVGTNVPATNNFTFTDPPAQFTGQRFYRVVQLP